MLAVSEVAREDIVDIVDDAFIFVIRASCIDFLFSFLACSSRSASSCSFVCFISFTTFSIHSSVSLSSIDGCDMIDSANEQLLNTLSVLQDEGDVIGRSEMELIAPNAEEALLEEEEEEIEEAANEDRRPEDG